MYLAQKSGGAEREKLLEKCVKDFSDAYYLDGCSVGGLSRLYLAAYYQQNGKDSAVKKLVDEIEKNYAEATDHGGPHDRGSTRGTEEKMIIDSAIAAAGCGHRRPALLPVFGARPQETPVPRQNHRRRSLSR